MNASKLSFIAELQRRNVHRAAVFYAGAAWLVVQIATQVFPFFHIAESVVRWVVIAVLIGFPFAMLFSWFYEWTPQGIKRESEIDHSESITQETGKQLDKAIIAVLALAVFVLLLNQFVLHRFLPLQGAARPDKSIAVLPLVDIGADDKDRYLGDGISGELLTALSKLPGLKVIGRTSSFQFRGRDVDAGKVGSALQVRNLLAGTVQRVDDELRITVELVDTLSGQQLWSQHYDRSFKNLFELEDDISGAVSKALAIKLGAVTEKTPVSATDNPRAHDLYLRASLLNQHSDQASFRQAIALFKQALALDPNYAAAWAGLSNTYIGLADAYEAPSVLLPAMLEAAEKAIALDPGNAEAHAQLGAVLGTYVRDYPAALRELDRAVALDPDSALAHDSRGLYPLVVKRDAAAARAEERIAQQLDPLNPWYPYWEMSDAIVQGDFPGAQTIATKVLQLDPRFFYRGDPLVLALAAASRWEPCVERARTVPGEGEDPPDFAAAICYEHVGDTAHARKILEKLEAAGRNGYTDHSNIAAVRLALGDRDGALAELDQADRDRSAPLMSAWGLPWFASLHGDARFQALLDRISAGVKREATP